MNNLSPRARALIEASRKALRPTQSDRERIESALRAKLSAPAASPDTGMPRGRSVGRWVSVAGAAVGVCVLGAIVYRSLVTTAPAPTAHEHPAPKAVEAPAIPPQPLAAEETPPPPPIAAPRKNKARASTPDALALEVALLSEATSQLRSGDANAALKTLQEHQRKFPNGTLRQERNIAKAQALCSLGRLQEGRAELERLPPNAPATARAQESCDGR